MTPIVYSDGLIDYVVAYFDSNIKLQLLYYKYNMNTNKNTYYSKTTEDNLKQRVCDYDSCYYSYSNYYDFKNKGLSCIYLENKYIYKDNCLLVCFFITKTSYDEYLEELVFSIGTNAITKSTNYKHDYIKFNFFYILNIYLSVLKK